MGFSTNITISNDFWHEIAKDPQKLVDGIGVAMNYGTNSPLSDALDEQRGDADSLWDRHYRMTPQGVLVHKAQHNDVPQVICSTYGSHAIAAHELPYAIEKGWLNGGKYRRAHAEAVATVLHGLARDIRKALKEATDDDD